MKLPFAVAVCLFTAATVMAHPDDPKIRDRQPPYVGPSYRQAVDGPVPFGGPGLFAASGVELKSWITLSDLTTLTGQAQDNGNSCFGYTSPSGREYAIMGLYSGTAFVEVTNPANAQFAGYIDGPNSLWRDIRVYQNYAYAGSEGGGGIQVISLSNIDAATNRVALVNTVTADGTIPTMNSHTLEVNVTSGFLYRCGGGNNGLRIYSLANPASPQFVAQWSDRYVHECQVVNYTTGPFAGREIAIVCSGFNGGHNQTGLDFLDVTNKQNIINLYPPRLFWTSPGYSHQICLSPDRNYAYLNDELDEGNFGINTRTVVIDTRFLKDAAFTAPVVSSYFFGSTPAIGHNLYTKSDLIFEANYRSGLQIYCTANPTAPTEIAFFDTYPDDNAASFNGAWNNYPYFPSGTVIVSDIERGLFVLDVSQARNTLLMDFPLGHPAFVLPNGSTTIRASVKPAPCGNATIAPGSVTLHYNAGNGPASVPMVHVGGDDFEAPIGVLPCGAIVSYYVSAENDFGTTFTNPPLGAAGAVVRTVAFGDVTDAYDNFETDTGWTTAMVGATAGGWQRGVPVNDSGWAYDPATDGDGSGRCWLTGNADGNTDVDGGSVQLTSTTFSLLPSLARVSYMYFIKMTTPSAGDGLFVEVSSNGPAGPWTLVRSYTTDGGLAWHSDEIEAAELTSLGVTINGNMTLRFTAADINPGAIVEAAIDGFRLGSLDCDGPCPGADGDLNGDLQVDGRDISVFASAVGGSPTAGEICHGDFSADEALSAADIPGLVGSLLTP